MTRLRADYLPSLIFNEASLLMCTTRCLWCRVEQTNTHKHAHVRTRSHHEYMCPPDMVASLRFGTRLAAHAPTVQHPHELRGPQVLFPCSWLLSRFGDCCWQLASGRDGSRTRAPSPKPKPERAPRPAAPRALPGLAVGEIPSIPGLIGNGIMDSPLLSVS